MNTTLTHTRENRSFVRREGRFTTSQRQALEQYWDKYGLALCSDTYNWGDVFGRQAERTLEIGFGNGTALLEMACVTPERDFIGIEVHRPGVGQLLRQIEQFELTNLRVFCDDAVQVLKQCVADASLHRVQIFFPDPWPKKKHHKRRLIQPAFLDLLAKKLVQDGILHIATDWTHYAEHILQSLDEHAHFANTVTQYAPRPTQRPLTKYEQRGQRLGHLVYDVIFRRC